MQYYKKIYNKILRGLSRTGFKFKFIIFIRNTVYKIFSYSAPIAISCLVVQIITGLLLAILYIPSVDLAFQIVEYVMREVRMIFVQIMNKSYLVNDFSFFLGLNSGNSRFRGYKFLWIILLI